MRRRRGRCSRTLRERHHEAIRSSSGGRDVHHPCAGGHCTPSPGRFSRDRSVVLPTSIRASSRTTSRWSKSRVAASGRRTKQTASTAAGGGATPLVAGLDAKAFRTRAPLDLGNDRLRRLAAALGPAYMRVSGTWANSTYFHDADGPPSATPPEGFGGVLTRAQWRGVVEFAKATDAALVTSFAISAGTRDASGAWTPDQLRKLLAYTDTVGGHITAAEFFNEPNVAVIGGAPKGYDAAAYARDFGVFLPFIRKAAPDLRVLGPDRWARAACSPTTPGSGARRCSRPPVRRGRLLLPFVQQRLEALRRRGRRRTPSAHARGGVVDRLARAHRARRLPLRGVARSLRARQADLAHRDGRDRLWRQSLALDVHGHVPLCRTARSSRQARRPGGDAQHARRPATTRWSTRTPSNRDRAIGRRCCGSG